MRLRCLFVQPIETGRLGFPQHPAHVRLVQVQRGSDGPLGLSGLFQLQGFCKPAVFNQPPSAYQVVRRLEVREMPAMPHLAVLPFERQSVAGLPPVRLLELNRDIQVVVSVRPASLSSVLALVVNHKEATASGSQVGQEVVDSTRPGAAKKGDKSMAESFTRMRTDFLINSQLWGDAAATWSFPDLADQIDSQLTFDFATALSKLKQHDAHAQDAVARFEDTRQKFVIWNAKQESPDESADKRSEILGGELEALLEESRGRQAKAIDRLRKLAVQEHALPVEFGPPFVNKPVDELLGEILLEQHELGGAHWAFSAALAAAPGRKVATAGLEASRGSASGSVANEVPDASKAAHH